LRDAFAAHAQHAPAVGARRHLDRHLAVQGRNAQGGAEGELGEVHRDGDGEVVAGAAEHRVRRDEDLHVQVTGRGAAATRLTLTGEPDALLVVHTRRNAHRQGARPGAHALARALRARGVDDRPASAAVTARFGERERPLTPVDQTGAAAGRAGPRLGARPGAGPAARAAFRRAGQPQRHRGTAHRLDEVDTDLRLHVRAAPGRRGRGGRAPVEQVAEHVPEATEPAAPGGVEQVAEVEAARPAAGEAEPALAAGPEERARLVVLAALLRVRQHAVRLGDGL